MITIYYSYVALLQSNAKLQGPSIFRSSGRASKSSINDRLLHTNDYLENNLSSLQVSLKKTHYIMHITVHETNQLPTYIKTQDEKVSEIKIKLTTQKRKNSVSKFKFNTFEI